MVNGENGNGLSNEMTIKSNGLLQFVANKRDVTMQLSTLKGEVKD